MNDRWTTKNGRTSRRGLFVNGVWHCDCEIRLPAEKFQVKNGGKNHGRWFFTCQKPQSKRCKFFLWSDDAKIREEAAVLGNSRTEPGAEGGLEVGEGVRLRSVYDAPQTPKRQTKISQPLTPVSKPRISSELEQKPGPSSVHTPDAFEDNFDWSSSDEQHLAHLADSLNSAHNPTTDDDDESPRKVAKISQHSSPSKRSYTEMKTPASSTVSSSSTWLIDDADHFVTPTTSTKSANRSGMISPDLTPSHVSRRLFLAPIQDDCKIYERHSALALEALSILSPVRSVLGAEIEQKLMSLLNRHELRSQGISKGRDIARSAIESKNKKITDLQQQITVLEAERETTKSVIQHLKKDIATSPKRPRRPRDINRPSDEG